MTRRLVRILLWAVAMAVATWGLGWWAVPVVAAAIAVVGVRGSSRPPRSLALSAAGAAALGWALLLAVDVGGANFGEVRALLGRILQLPWPVVLLLTLLLPALLAWCAAALAEGALALWRPAGQAAQARGEDLHGPADRVRSATLS